MKHLKNITNQFYELISGTNPEKCLEQFKQGLDFALKNEFKKARSQLVEVLNLNHSNPFVTFTITIIDDVKNDKLSKDDARRVLKSIRLGLDGPNEGLQELNEILKDSKLHYPILYEYRADRLSKMGDYDGAIADLTKVIDKNQSWKTYCFRAAVYLQKRLYDEAISDCSEALRMNSLDIESILIRGSAYLYKEQIDLAISDFSEAIKLGCNTDSVFEFRAYAYAKKGDAKSCVKDCNKALKINNKNSEVYLYLGYALFDLDRDSEAIIALENYLKYTDKNDERILEVKKELKDFKDKKT